MGPVIKAKEGGEIGFVIFGTIFLVTGILFLLASKAIANVNQWCEK